MDLSIKHKNKKEFFGEESSCGTTVITLIYFILFISELFFVFFSGIIKLPFWSFFLKLLLSWLVLFLPWIIYNIIRKSKFNKDLWDIKFSLELFTYSKGFESYEEFEKELYTKSKKIDFTGFKIPCKDELDNPQHYIKKSIYAVYVRKIIENHLNYFNKNKKDCKIIEQLSLLEVEATNLKKVKEIFIEDRTESFIKHFLYQDNFVPVEETLKKIEQYSNTYKKEKGKKLSLFFNSYTFSDMDKIIKENIKAKNLLNFIPACNIVLLFSILVSYALYINKIEDIVCNYIIICIIVIISLAFLAFNIYVIKYLSSLAKKETKFFEVAKYLPITKEEFADLNIKEYNEAENFVFNLFDDIDIPKTKFEETISKTLKRYLIEHIETDKIAKKLFENSFIAYYEDEEPDYSNLIENFAIARTYELINIIKEKPSKTVEETLNEILIYGKADKIKYDFLMENKKLTVVKFTLGDFID